MLTAPRVRAGIVQTLTLPAVQQVRWLPAFSADYFPTGNSIAIADAAALPTAIRNLFPSKSVNARADGLNPIFPSQCDGKTGTRKTCQNPGIPCIINKFSRLHLEVYVANRRTFLRSRGAVSFLSYARRKWQLKISACRMRQPFHEAIVLTIAVL